MGSQRCSGAGHGFTAEVKGSYPLVLITSAFFSPATRPLRRRNKLRVPGSNQNAFVRVCVCKLTNVLLPASCNTKPVSEVMWKRGSQSEHRITRLETDTKTYIGHTSLFLPTQTRRESYRATSCCVIPSTDLTNSAISIVGRLIYSDHVITHTQGFYCRVFS